MAINLKNLKPHTPTADLRDYVTVIFGRPKAGKTSLFHGIINEHYNGDMSKGLLLACESGYNALKGIVAQDIERWEDFQEAVSQLVEEREDMPFEMVGVDTVDKLWDLVTEYVIRKKKREDNKPYKVLNDIPWGGGHELVSKEVDKQLQKLKRAGYGLVLLTHDKDKKFQSRDGVDYDKTTVSLSGRARDLILNMADFITFIDVAKEANDEKEDSFVDARYIYFRSDSSDLEVGSRFKNVPDKIPYSPEGFLEAFKTAVLSEYDGNKSFDKLVKEQEKEREERVQAKIAEMNEEERKENVNPEDIIAEITKVVDGLTKEQKVEAKEKIVEIVGKPNYKKETDLDKLQQCLDAMKEIASAE